MIPTETWVLPRPRKDAYVGFFPLHFEQRLWLLMGKPAKVLHPFGGLAEIGERVDLNASTTPDWVGDAHDLHFIEDGSYDLVILDPPYSDEEAEWLYGTPKLRPGKFTAEAVRVCREGGHVAVYHRAQPKRPPGTRLSTWRLREYFCCPPPRTDPVRILLFAVFAYTALGIFAGVMSHSWTTGLGVGFGAPLAGAIGIGIGMMITRG